MSGLIDRKLVIELIVMLGVCAGAWMLLVQPKAKELRELEQQIAEAQSNPAIHDQNAVTEMAGQIEAVRDRVAEIEARNRLGREASKVYGHVTSLALKHEVTLERLDPGAARTTGGEDPVDVTSFDMRVQGKYREVAAFLEAVENIDGFVRPVRLSLAPRGEEGSVLVDARFVCEAVTFPMPEVLAAMVGDGHVDE